MLDDVLGDQAQSFPGTDERFELRPCRLQLLARSLLVGLGDLLKLLIDPGLLVVGEIDAGKSRLVVDRHRRSVFD